MIRDEMHSEVTGGEASFSREINSLLTVEEAARTLRIGRNMCYELIRQKQIPHVRLGRLIRVPRFGLESWLARQAGLPEPTPTVVSFNPQRH